MAMDDVERDMPECEQYNLSPGDVGYKPKYLVKEMMGETYTTYFPEDVDEERDRIEQERNADHAQDNKF